MRTLSPQESSESSKQKQDDFQNTTRSSALIETLLLYRTRGPGCVSENNLDSFLIIFFSFYCNDHLLRSESSKKKQNDFQNTTRSPMETLLLYRTRGPGCVRKIILIVSSLFFFSFYCNDHLLEDNQANRSEMIFKIPPDLLLLLRK